MPSLDIHSPLQAAVGQMAARRVTPSGMTSREWELLPAEIRLRAMFSSQVEHERTLSEMQDRMRDSLANVKRDGATMDRSRFIEEMHGIIRQSGYKRPADVKKGSLRDLKSSRRLGLIWDMNVAQARGYARWAADMTPEGLENEPCYELIRVMNRAEIRDWPAIWKAAGGKFYDGEGSNDDYPFAPGRMIAKKTDPIWRMISRFGTPWPPFDWGSGMGLRGLGRDESDALGITRPEEVLEPETAPFNTAVKSNVRGISAEGRQRVLDTLAGDVEIVGDEIRIIPPARKDAMSPERKKSDWKPSGIRTVKAGPPDGRTLLEKARFEDTMSRRDIRGRIQRAAAMAHEVIGGGNLPGFLTRFGSPLISIRMDGAYIPTTESSQANPIWVADIMPGEAGFAELAWLHELGHLVDNRGLHTPVGEAYYASENHPPMGNVMKEIFSSVAAGRYRYSYGADDRDATPREFFARAFAQFIAEESGDPDLARLLLRWRNGAFERDGWPRDFHWHRADFKPIKKALRALFARNGWKGGGQ